MPRTHAIAVFVLSLATLHCGSENEATETETEITVEEVRLHDSSPLNCFREDYWVAGCAAIEPAATSICDWASRFEGIALVRIEGVSYGRDGVTCDCVSSTSPIDLELTVIESLYGSDPGQLIGRFPRTGRLFSGLYEYTPPCFQPGFVIGLSFTSLAGLTATHALDDAMAFYLDGNERVIFEQTRFTAPELGRKCLAPLPEAFAVSLSELRSILSTCAEPSTPPTIPNGLLSHYGRICWSCE